MIFQMTFQMIFLITRFLLMPHTLQFSLELTDVLLLLLAAFDLLYITTFCSPLLLLGCSLSGRSIRLYLCFLLSRFFFLKF